MLALIDKGSNEETHPGVLGSWVRAGRAAVTADGDRKTVTRAVIRSPASGAGRSR
jgi:hypothetical protein